MLRVTIVPINGMKIDFRELGLRYISGTFQRENGNGIDDFHNLPKDRKGKRVFARWSIFRDIKSEGVGNNLASIEPMLCDATCTHLPFVGNGVFRVTSVQNQFLSTKPVTGLAGIGKFPASIFHMHMNRHLGTGTVFTGLNGAGEI